MHLPSKLPSFLCFSLQDSRSMLLGYYVVCAGEVWVGINVFSNGVILHLYLLNNCCCVVCGIYIIIHQNHPTSVWACNGLCIT